MIYTKEWSWKSNTYLLSGLMTPVVSVSAPAEFTGVLTGASLRHWALAIRKTNISHMPLTGLQHGPQQLCSNTSGYH